MLNKNNRKVNFYLISTAIIISILSGVIWIRYNKRAPLFLLSSSLCVIIILLSKETILLYLYAAFCWFPVSLSCGPLGDFFIGAYTAEIAVYAVFIAWVIKCFIIGKLTDSFRSILKTPFLLPLILYALGGIIAYLAENYPDKEVAYRLLRENCFYGVIVYFLCSRFIKNTAQLSNFVIAMVIGGCMLGGYYLYILKHNPYMLYGTKEVLRLGGKIFFGEFKADITCLVLGNYFATLIPLSAAIFLFSASRFKKYTCLLAFFLLSYLLFLTGSRSCWMGAIVSIAVIIILGKKYSKGHSLQFALFISLIIAASLLAISHGVVSEYLLVRIKSLQNASEDVSLVARFKIWAGGLNLLFSNPLGMSFWQFYDLCPNYKTTPHNLFISIGLTNGFIGLFGFIWFIFAWFKKMISFLKFGCSENKIFYIGIIAGMVSFLFNGLFDSYNFCFLNISQMWMIFGAAVWSLRDG